MKTKINLLVLIISVLVYSCGDSKTKKEKEAEMNLALIVTFEHPSSSEVNDYIKVGLDVLTKAVDKTLTDMDINEFDAKTDVMISNIEKNNNMVENSQEIDPSTPLKESSIAYSKNCKSLFEIDFKKIVELLKEESNENVAASVYLFVDTWDKILDLQESNLVVRDRYMKKYKINLVNDKSSEDIKESRRQYIDFNQKLKRQ